MKIDKDEIIRRLNAAALRKRQSDVSAPVGLGTALQRGIHAVVDLAPIPAALRMKIKSCPGCGRSAARLNRAVRNVNPFAKNLPPEENSTKPTP